MTDLFAREHGARTGQRTVARHVAPKQPSRVGKGAFQALPLVLAGTIAMGLTLTGPIETAQSKPDDKPADSRATLRKAVANAMAAASFRNPHLPTTVATGMATLTSVTPSTYRVVAGDTVSSIAARHGLSTASVLTLNGLGWKSLIFPGQVLRLSAASVPSPAPKPSTPTTPTTPVSTITYTIVRGDTISAIATRYGVSTQSLLTANGLRWTSIIYPGQRIVISQGSAAVTPPAPAPVTPPQDPVINIVPVVDVTPISNPAPTTPAPAPAPAPAPLSITYVIHAGDTVTAIAARFGVSVQSILDANGLNRTSIIYTGRTLIIHGATATPASVGGPTTILTAEMAANATIIVAVGRSLGVSDYGLVIALAAAMQESSLRNLNYGDRDSLGLFQQRPSTGWGTPAQVTDPVHAATLFFGGPTNPNRGKTRGLLDYAGWQSMSVTQAAQTVQRSAYPNAYAKWEASARAWLAQLS